MLGVTQRPHKSQIRVPPADVGLLCLLGEAIHTTQPHSHCFTRQTVLFYRRMRTSLYTLGRVPWRGSDMTHRRTKSLTAASEMHAASMTGGIRVGGKRWEPHRT